MATGLNYVYQCPICNMLLYHNSLTALDNAKSRLYSDGKRVAVGLPIDFKTTKCPCCMEILWVGDMDFVEVCEPQKMESSLGTISKEMQFLDIDDLVRALEEDRYQGRLDIISIRQKILWAFNDRVRQGLEIHRSEEDQSLWNRNINELLLLLDIAYDNQLFLIAELHRSLRNFNKSVELLRRIDDPVLKGYAGKLIKACEMEYTSVIRLQ